MNPNYGGDVQGDSDGVSDRMEDMEEMLLSQNPNDWEERHQHHAACWDGGGGDYIIYDGCGQAPEHARAEKPTSTARTGAGRVESEEEDRGQGERPSGSPSPMPSPELEPLLSILNLTVDHVMVPPTPLEPEEFQNVCSEMMRQTGDAKGLDEDGQVEIAEKETDAPAPHPHLLPEPPPPSSDRILVPVLRFFGPVVRGDPARQPSRLRSWRQSGCLHVHGAFPYLLARPVAAGPDGSSHHRGSSAGPGCDGDSGGDGHGGDGTYRIDWDDPRAVILITDEVQSKLEGALRASAEWRAKRDTLDGIGGEKGPGDREGEKEGSMPGKGTNVCQDRHVHVRYIRKVTVVTGRGFYTYCSGPPAPFLRIEYYDPKVKWKVKLMLERGLELGLACHPDSCLYDYGGSSTEGHDPNAVREGQDKIGEGSSQDGDIRLLNPPLKFRCYEAHIPYTMQVFKDYNLSGMSYVKVADGRFRQTLPKQEKQRSKGQSRRNHSEALFLESTVPDSLIWKYLEGPEIPQSSELQVDESHVSDSPNEFSPDRNLSQTAAFTSTPSPSSFSPSQIKSRTPSQISVCQSMPCPLSRTEQYWTRCESSCDVELDTTASHLLNINDVMTSLPADTIESSHIHWRAVPSLREIWQLERKRMALLLKRDDNFLSISTEPPYIGGAQSQSQSIDSGDESEEGKTPPFTLSVKKDASRPGTRLAVKGVKRLYNPSPGLEGDYNRALSDIITRHLAFIDGVDAALKRKEKGSFEETSELLLTTRNFSPASSQDDALFALNALGSQFGGNGKSRARKNVAEVETISQYAESQSSTFHNSPSFPATEVAPFTQAEMEEIHEAVRFGQKVERGDAIELSDNVQIDPFTLRAYSEDESYYDNDFLDEEEKLGEEGFARSLCTLATQIPLDVSESTPDFDLHQSESHERARNTFEEEESEEQYIFEIESSDNVLQISPNKRSSSDKSVGPQDTTKTRERTKTRVHDLSNLMHGQYIMPSLNPPRSAECGKGRRWHPMKRSETESYQTWLQLSAAAINLSTYIGRPEDFTALSDFSNRFRNIFIEPTRRPPSSCQVSYWLKKLEKRKLLDSANADFVQAKKKSKKHSKKERRKLQIDSNSTNIIAAPAQEHKLWKGDGFAKNLQRTCQGFTVEEVEWDAINSMRSQLSPSPSQSSAQQLTYRVHDKEVTEHSNGRSHVNQSKFTGVVTTLSSSDRNSIGSINDPLDGIGQQGGRIHVAGGGGLKVSEDESSTSKLASCASPVTIISIEVHVQCRSGKASANDSKIISMRPDPARDGVSAISYVYALDPGGGEKMQIIERGCLFTPLEAELACHSQPLSSQAQMPSLSNSGDFARKYVGMPSQVKMELVRSERHLLLRVASIVKWKDPDALVSWDTQGGGIGYLIERGAALGGDHAECEDTTKSSRKRNSIDMVKLLGRIIKKPTSVPATKGGSSVKKSGISNNDIWSGSGLGSDWDDRVGAGAAASSVEGRIVMCGWKLVSEEVKHPNSSYLPAMVSTILNKRIPNHDDLILTRWYSSENGRQRWRVLEHRLAQATSTLMLFDALDIIGRAGEAARLSGVEFSQSLPGIRGSQYKVEGVLLRALQSVWSDERGEKHGKNKLKFHVPSSQIASESSASLSNKSKSQSESPWKLLRGPVASSHDTDQGTVNPEAKINKDRGYFFYSPSKEDCSKQEALECQAMTLEPQSGFHFDPVVVCDFTALYPSLVIAYNLCYSTLAGKLDYHSTRKEMRQEGMTTNKIGPFDYAERRTAAVLKHHMKSLSSTVDSKRKDQDRAYVVPTGSIFVSESVVKGVLPQVLDEILSTRAMLKKAAKQYKKLVPNLSPSILRSLEAKQLALKYVANVTYGYTSATFSGRSAMPLLADAIVECGRRTLTNAIELVQKWSRDPQNIWHGAQVIYGDTDSIFVKLPHRSVPEAFRFGEEFCTAVTASNPPPVSLKLEKVYVASLFQTKKKYCGMKFESPFDKRPVFEAKGIETVRRDQCVLTQKILRNFLVTIFKNGLDASRAYLQRQWSLIHAGRLPVSDFVLTGRVRSQYRGGKIGPVQAALAKRLAEADPGRTMRHKERLPYVIVAAPGLTFRLRDCVMTPTELLEQWDSFTIHSEYYVKKHVNAALQRCLGLDPYKVDVNTWYEASPKPRKRIHHWPVTRTGASAMITSHFGSDSCTLCGAKCKAQGSSRAVVCSGCSSDKVSAAFLAMGRLNEASQQADRVASICRACSRCPESSLTFAMERSSNFEKRGVALSAPIKGPAGVITPLANCVCTDCPVTFERHHLREAQIEADALCRALDLF